MELWVIAELLGINDAEQATTGPVTEGEFRARAEELNKRRVEHARLTQAAIESGEDLPPPMEAPESVGPEVTPDMIRALRERRQQREAQQGA